MANMSYCRFENTASDLRDCVLNWDSELDEYEQRGKDSIILLAKQLLSKEGFIITTSEELVVGYREEEV